MYCDPSSPYRAFMDAECSEACPRLGSPAPAPTPTRTPCPEGSAAAHFVVVPNHRDSAAATIIDGWRTGVASESFDNCAWMCMAEAPECVAFAYRDVDSKCILRKKVNPETRLTASKTWTYAYVDANQPVEATNCVYDFSRHTNYTNGTRAHPNTQTKEPSKMKQTAASNQIIRNDKGTKGLEKFQPTIAGKQKKAAVNMTTTHGGNASVDTPATNVRGNAAGSRNGAGSGGSSKRGRVVNANNGDSVSSSKSSSKTTPPPNTQRLPGPAKQSTKKVKSRMASKGLSLAGAPAEYSVGIALSRRAVARWAAASTAFVVVMVLFVTTVLHQRRKARENGILLADVAAEVARNAGETLNPVMSYHRLSAPVAPQFRTQHAGNANGHSFAPVSSPARVILGGSIMGTTENVYGHTGALEVLDADAACLTLAERRRLGVSQISDDMRDTSPLVFISGSF